ncbi:hypothetical protein ACFYVK_35230 [Streptomyces chartreusis]|uniref:hypothetical protein n=1 Tax=Streptomyces chartreusis TaxID=1969 RepID=UPI00369BE25A
MATQELTGALNSVDHGDTPPLPPAAVSALRSATVADVVARLKADGGLYEWTAVHALGWGMGPAQNDISAAVEAAEAAGLVRTTTLRGKKMVQLASRADRVNVLRESIARRALASIGTPTDARILRIVFSGPVLTVATEQPGQYFPFGVDTFRLPTADETDLEQDEPLGLSEWVLADQYGGFGEDEVEQMMADAASYAATLRKAVA